MRKNKIPVSLLRPSIVNVDAFTHLRKIIAVGRKNRGRLQFLLRGFVKKYPVNTWSKNTFNLLLRYVQHAQVEVSFKRIKNLVESLRTVAYDNIRTLIILCRFDEEKKVAPRLTTSNRALRPQKSILSRILGDELEIEYKIIV